MQFERFLGGRSSHLTLRGPGTDRQPTRRSQVQILARYQLNQGVAGFRDPFFFVPSTTECLICSQGV